MRTRALRRSICRLLVGVLLFAQVTIAAYACPAMSTAGVDQIEPGGAFPAMVVVPDASQDRALPNLCTEHCRYGQAVDLSATPAVPAALLVSLYEVPLAPESAGRAQPLAARGDPSAAAPPPHAILHCCFRI